jgi:hypothetical protein
MGIGDHASVAEAALQVRGLLSDLKVRPPVDTQTLKPGTSFGILCRTEASTPLMA